ncbi:MAG: TadE/TadG family type IV pilus assembly protein [Pirellulales bacterium]
MRPSRLTPRPIMPSGFAGRPSVLASAADRKGAVVVEFAITAGLLFMIVFAAIEFMRVNTIVNSTENAAYEGARAGIVPGAKAKDVKDAAGAMLAAIGVRGAKIDVEPDAIQPDTPEVTVTIDVPLDSNSFIAPRYFLGKTLTKTCTLTREVPNAQSGGS